MPTKYRLPLSVIAIVALEALIVIWFTFTIDESLFFEKCARNSGRVSAGINLALLLFIGKFGLKNIYESSKRETFHILVVMYAVNHLIHGYFIYQNFSYKSYELKFMDPLHGFITFVLVLLFPLFTWKVKQLSKLTYTIIILHFFNTTYFLILTFYGRIKPERPEYMHQAGILIMIGALLWILFRVYKETIQKDVTMQ
ncbi:MAG: hypothetical protein ACJAV5_001628 [Vicingaceae bacterium]|jgi:hypothetical protein